MANHKSALKRIRQTQSRRLRNRYYAKTARNAVRRLRAMTDKAQAQETYVDYCVCVFLHIHYIQPA